MGRKIVQNETIIKFSLNGWFQSSHTDFNVLVNMKDIPQKDDQHQWENECAYTTRTLFISIWKDHLKPIKMVLMTNFN